MRDYQHISVLLKESIEMLNVKSSGSYLDCTIGGGGHSSVILSLVPEGHLYGFDQDEYAIQRATEKLTKISSNFTLYQDNFRNINHYFEERTLDGIIYDLGVSSFQFDIPERGFSYRFDGPLDMRMNQEEKLTAADIINGYDEQSLTRIFYEYGEEKYAPRIAHRIVMERQTTPILTTFQLVETIKRSLPAKELRKTGHPAKQVFQALRIEVNHELDYLKNSIHEGLKKLKKGGRMVVITFHSLEDRIVKQIFKEYTTLHLPKGLPYVPEGYEVNYQLINSKVVLPTEEELEKNPRSHSAKMRGIERLN